MKLFFWENIISHLRTPFFKELVKTNHYEVTLIVDQELTDGRKKLGWKINEIDGVRVLIKPSEQQIIKIIEDNYMAYHCLSGINVYPSASLALKHLVKRGVKFSIYSEQFKKQGFKGLLRKFKSKVEFKKYGRYIKGVYAIGDDAVKWYKKAGYNSKLIHQWIYFSELFATPLIERDNNFLFVGELSDRKNILKLIDTFLKIKFTNSVKLKIVGSGILKEKILHASLKHPDKIEYLGVLSTEAVREEMTKSKVLILPSIFDGWGAVINEALLSGCYCITSDNCGSKTLFRNNSFLGKSFSLKKKHDLNLILKETVEETNQINGEEIKLWARKNLDVSIAVDYFLKTLEYCKNTTTIKPKAPWLK